MWITRQMTASYWTAPASRSVRRQLRLITSRRQQFLPPTYYGSALMGRNSYSCHLSATLADSVQRRSPLGDVEHDSLMQFHSKNRAD